MKRLVTPLVHDADEALPASVAQLLPPHGRTPYGLYASARLANASRALGISFPTVVALLGDDTFQTVAYRFAQTSPHTDSDWGQWGEAFPAWLAEQVELMAWPYLPDVAQLDWLCHTSERTHDDAPHVQLMTSAFPVVAIWWAHHGPEAERAAWMAQAKEALPKGETCNVVVHRAHWRATATAVSADSFLSLSSALKEITSC